MYIFLRSFSVHFSLILRSFVSYICIWTHTSIRITKQYNFAPNVKSENSRARHRRMVFLRHSISNQNLIEKTYSWTQCICFSVICEWFSIKSDQKTYKNCGIYSENWIMENKSFRIIYKWTVYCACVWVKKKCAQNINFE